MPENLLAEEKRADTNNTFGTLSGFAAAHGGKPPAYRSSL